MKITKPIFYLFFLFTLFIESLCAQEITSTAGGDILEDSGSAAFTVGQVVFAAHQFTNGSITEGVQQSYLIADVTSAFTNENIKLNCNIYPNPTSDYLKLKLENITQSEVSTFEYHLFDISGNMIKRKQISNIEELIDMSKQVSATYFLKVVSKNLSLDSSVKSTFKIVKQ